LHRGYLEEHATAIKNIQKAISELLKLMPERAEFIHQPSREHKEIRFLVTLNGLRLAAENTLKSFDDLGQRLECFCEVQNKADELYEMVAHLDLQKDIRKQIALYIKTAVLNVYSENLKRKNLEALLKALSVASQPKLRDSDRRKVLHILYSGGLHAFPHLKGNLSEVIAERKD
jgi:hypothetical protein